MLKDYLPSYTEFNRIALKEGSTLCLRAWYLLKAQDKAGCGWIKRGTAIQALGAYYTQRGLLNLLKSGEGVWWHTDGEVLHITGLQKIAVHMRTKPGHRVLLPIYALESFQLFKAFIYSTYFTHEPRVLSRATIEQLFGISKRTQIRYESLAKVIVVKQFGHSKVTEDTLLQLPIADRLSTEEKRGVWTEDVDNDGEMEIVWQLSNQYKATIPLYDKNMKGRFSISGGSDLSDGAEPAKKQRIYYTDVKKVTRKYNAGHIRKEGVYLLTKDKSSKRIYEYIAPYSTTKSATH